MSETEPTPGFPEMETKCCPCNRVIGDDGRVLRACYSCDSTGWIPTDFGRKILAMVHRDFDRYLRERES